MANNNARWNIYKAPTGGELVRGLRCKACNKPIDGDPELCTNCLRIAHDLNNDIDSPEPNETAGKVQD